MDRDEKARELSALGKMLGCWYQLRAQGLSFAHPKQTANWKILWRWL